MNRALKCIPIAALSLLGAVGCNDFLSGGDLDTDPNNPPAATNSQLFVAAQASMWALHLSDPARLGAVFVQQYTGGGLGYLAIEEYDLDESTTNGIFTGIYTGGGLIDIRRLQANVREAGDSIYLGQAQVLEALVMGAAADIFGDVVYSAAYGEENPPLDEQLSVYDQIQTLLDDAIENLAATGPTNFGAGAADLNYGGDPEPWTRLAWTLKARYYLHTAEVRGATAYAAARDAASKGLTDPDEDYKAQFSGNAGEENFTTVFVQLRSGYISPNPFFVNLLESRSDPRLTRYFDDDAEGLSDELLASDYDPPIVSAAENRLIWAEAAFRTGQTGVAQTQLTAARAIAGLPSVTASLGEILTEKYIALFQTLEPWNDYKRTCFPNLVPNGDNTTIPARLYYDTRDRQTNTSIPDPTAQPVRNDNDPPNAVDDVTGAECLGQ